MASDPDAYLEEGRLDLVPMIDCIMLLLLFFILTTKFSTEEKTIASLLPTDKGNASTPRKDRIEPPQMVNILVYPAGMERGLQPSGYKKQYEALVTPEHPIIPAAALRIGGNAPIELRNDMFIKGPKLEANIKQVHAYIFDALKANEEPGKAARKDQREVVIHCFSGLSWRYALLAYDAVRAYEAEQDGTMKGSHLYKDPLALNNARSVSFAPPRIRNYTANELGNELFEIIHMK
jgi:hypothetical protein